MPCVVFRGDRVQFVGDDVNFYGPCLPDTPITDHGFTLKVNGIDYVLPSFNSDQLRQLHLGDASFDAQIASGTFVMPGAPGWVAGTRLAFYADDADATFIGNYFTTDRGQRRQNVETGVVETAYTLMDVNRNFIGTRVVNYSPAGDPDLFPTGTSSQWISAVAALVPTPLDDTTWVDAGATEMRNKVYNSDGAMDLIGDLIIFTGKTTFLRATADAEYELHFHDINIGPLSDIRISDDVDDLFNGNTFSPVNASVTWSAADIKTDVEISNGSGNVVSASNGGDVIYGVGGLKWEFQGSFGVDEDGLIVIANNLLATGGAERPTYQCTIGPLTGAQVAAIPAGAAIGGVISEAMDLSTEAVWVRNRSLTMWVDDAGSPVPGLWNVGLEFAYPFRQPTDAVGYGGQGGYSGLLEDPFNFAVYVAVLYGDVWPPVGSSADVTGQLQGTLGQAVTQPGVSVTFTVEQFTDEGETAPCNDFSVWGGVGPPIPGNSVISATTNKVGQATFSLSHDVDTGCVKMRITGVMS